MNAPQRTHGTFERATREALESVVAGPVARMLFERAVAASARGRVPEDVGAFQAFVEGPLRTELERVLDASEISLVQERLGNVLWMATSDVRALEIARDWSRGRSPSAATPRTASGSERPAQSGSHRRIATSSVPPKPQQALAPTCVLVISLDAALAARTSAELAGRAPVLVISAPADLARAVTRAGERVVVLVDTVLPSIDVATFVGLAPILPPGTRIVLWGADASQLARLTARFPAARGWSASADSTTPGLFALSIGV